MTQATPAKFFRSLMSCLCVLGLCLLCTGCDDITGAMLETAVKSGAGDSPKRNSFAKRLQAIQSECPKEINDSITLKSVSLKGINRVEFKYVVAESGRETYNINNWRELQPMCLKWTQESPIAPSVIACNLSVKHLFEDQDGLSMYGHSIYKQDLKQPAKKDTPLAATPVSAPVVQPNVSQASPAPVVDQQDSKPAAGSGQQEAIDAMMYAAEEKIDSLAEAVGGPARSASNPAGVRENPYAQPSAGQGGVQGNPYGN